MLAEKLQLSAAAEQKEALEGLVCHDLASCVSLGYEFSAPSCSK
jgi:hypothetical protein